MASSARIAAAVPALALLLLGSPALADGLRFAVYGDMPYSESEQDFLAGEAAGRIAGDDGIAFVVALGDLGRPEGFARNAATEVRGGTTSCTDEWQVAQRALWRDGFRKPVFLTPGDNDWTDCDAERVPHPVSELARLDALRRIHFAVPPASVDAKWHYRAQPGQPENALWSTGGVQFATIHVVGTANGRRGIELDDRDLALALADARDAANLAWIAEAFRTARAGRAGAVVIAMQADPFTPDRDKAPTGAEQRLGRCLERPAFAPVCRELALQALAYPGPVLLVHGDTTAACLETITSADGRPLFWRLNAWGDFTLPLDIAVVEVDPANPHAPFRVSGLAGGRAIPETCRY
ncbi:hypothetical protein [Thalassobaculum sp.]|uniref:hypothetical protein n=1 Tax=Thalassobaculum sp. TaxID=2022740 RepID=UPI0032EC3E90